MGRNTLSEDDETILEHLQNDRNTIGEIASDTAYDPSFLAERLDRMTKNALVRRPEGEAYALTESGQRVISTSDETKTDEQIDTPDVVERALAGFDLAIEREESVRRAFTFLRSQAAATPAEIKEGVYDERPAGYESADQWWEQCVSPRLARLPYVERSSRDDDVWEHTGPKTTTESSDGRSVLDSDTDDPSTGDGEANEE